MLRANAGLNAATALRLVRRAGSWSGEGKSCSTYAEVCGDRDILACDLSSLKLGGLNDPETQSEIQFFTINGVAIPFASPKLLLRTKQTHRDKDSEDIFFLERKIAEGITKP